MVEPLAWKIKRLIRLAICKITGHIYGCCDVLLFPCSKCPYNLKQDERCDFLEFLWNTIQPNEMEQYWTMFHCKDVSTNGEAKDGE